MLFLGSSIAQVHQPEFGIAQIMKFRLPHAFSLEMPHLGLYRHPQPIYIAVDQLIWLELLQVHH